MDNRFRVHFLFRFCKVSNIILAFSIFVGHILGFLFAGNADASFLSLMHNIAFGDVSIVHLLLTTLFPFLITAISIWVSCYYLAIPVLFIESFLQAVCMWTIFQAFGTAWWFIYAILFFSDSLAFLILISFWFRFIWNRNTGIKDLLLYSSFALLAGMLDYLWIYPFLISLLNE